MVDTPESLETNEPVEAEGEESWIHDDEVDGAPVTWTTGMDTDSTAPHFVEILSEATPESENVLTNLACGFLADISRRFSGRVRAILKTEGEEMPVGEPLEKWKAAVPMAVVNGRTVDLTGPAHGDEFISRISTTTGTYTAEVGSSWDDVMMSHTMVRQYVAGVQYYRIKGAPEPEELNGDAKISMKFRPLDETDESLVVHRHPVSSALRDFAFYVFFNGPACQQRGDTLDFYLRGVNSVERAELWRDLIEYAEGALSLQGGTLTATVEISSPAAGAHLEHIAHATSVFATGLSMDKKAYLAAGGTEKSYTKDARNLAGVCGNAGLSAVGSLQGDLKGTLPSDKETAAVATAISEENGLGFTAHQVSHPGLLKAAADARNN